MMPFQPVTIPLGEGDIKLRLRQVDGLHRVAFACEAADIVGAIERGEAMADGFGWNLVTPLPVSEEAAARTRRYAVEMALALEWAWDGAEGLEAADPKRWEPTRAALVKLCFYGDPELGVRPLIVALGPWLNGPLVEIADAGERFGAVSGGFSAAAPPTAPAASL